MNILRRLTHRAADETSFWLHVILNHPMTPYISDGKCVIHCRCGKKFQR